MAEKAALITGGSSGIGLAIARMLGEDGYGLTVSARRPEKLEAAVEDLRSAGLDVQSVPANMADEESLNALVAAHKERYGRLDVLINNAGVGIGEAMDALTTKYVDMQLGVNLRAVILMTRECLPMLREAGAEHGKALLVNTASISGKAGQPWLSRVLGDEGGGDRVLAGDAEGDRGPGDSGDRVRAGVRRHADDRVRQGAGRGRGDDPAGGHRGGGAVPARRPRRTAWCRRSCSCGPGTRSTRRTWASSPPRPSRSGRRGAGRRGRRSTRRPGGGGRTRRPRSSAARRGRGPGARTMPRPRAVRLISRMRGGLTGWPPIASNLAPTRPGAVGPAELLAEEAELGGAVAVAGGRALGVGEAEAASLLEAEAELDVLGAGHVGVEGADAVEDVAAIRGVGGDRVGGVGVEGEALPVAEHAGRLALGRGRGRDVLEVAGRRCRPRGPRRGGRAR